MRKKPSEKLQGLKPTDSATAMWGLKPHLLKSGVLLETV
jgi:hypothetical protein